MQRAQWALNISIWPNFTFKGLLFKLYNLHVGATKEKADLPSIMLSYLFSFPHLWHRHKLHNWQLGHSALIPALLLFPKCQKNTESIYGFLDVDLSWQWNCSMLSSLWVLLVLEQKQHRWLSLLSQRAESCVCVIIMVIWLFWAITNHLRAFSGGPFIHRDMGKK